MSSSSTEPDIQGSLNKFPDFFCMGTFIDFIWPTNETLTDTTTLGHKGPGSNEEEKITDALLTSSVDDFAVRHGLGAETSLLLTQSTSIISIIQPELVGFPPHFRYTR